MLFSYLSVTDTGVRDTPFLSSPPPCFNVWGGTPACLTEIALRSLPLVIKATLYSCTSVTQPEEMSQPGCLQPLCSSWREGHSHRSVTPPAQDDRASLIHANAFGVKHVLPTAHFSYCTLILMFKTFDL